MCADDELGPLPIAGPTHELQEKSLRALRSAIPIETFEIGSWTTASIFPWS
jgi:hypothetical protein